jgi:hypothetical protein
MVKVGLGSWVGRSLFALGRLRMLAPVHDGKL